MRSLQLTRVIVRIRRRGRCVHAYTSDLGALEGHHETHDPNCWRCILLENAKIYLLTVKAGDVCLFCPPDGSNRRRYFWWGRYRVIKTKIGDGPDILVVVLDGSERTLLTPSPLESHNVGKVVEHEKSHRRFRVLRQERASHFWILLDLETNQEVRMHYNTRFYEVQTF